MKNHILYIFIFSLLLTAIPGTPLSAQDDRFVKFGIIADTPPISFIDENGIPQGYLVELFSMIMTDLGINFEIIPASYAEIYGGVLNGEIDLFASMLKTEDREKLFYFSDAGLTGGWGQFFINTEADYTNILSLRNKKIGMVIGDEIGQNFEIFMEQLNIPFIKVEFFTFQQMIDSIQSGNLYGGVIYSSYLLGVENIKVTQTVFSPQPAYPVTALDGSFIPELDRISERLKELKADEQSYFYSLQSKWLIERENKYSEYSSVFLASLLILAGITAFLSLNGLILKKTIRKRTKELLQSSTILEHSIEGIMVTDKNRHIIRVNKAFENITGYKSKEVIGRHVSVLKNPEQNRAQIDEMMDSLRKTGKWVGETWDRRKSGEIYPQFKSVVLIKDKKGEPVNYSFVFSDMTENRNLENRIHYISNYDRQTDLPNNNLFLDRLIMAGMNSDRENNILCIISLGIDNFKKINRSYGHNAGDQLLKKIGLRLKDICRKSDTVSRYGGDEFTILLTDINSQEDIIRIIENIKEKIERPFLIEGNELYTSCTQGISIYPSDSPDVKIIPRHANQALHIAKKRKKGSYFFYREEDDIVLKQRHKSETMLRSALNKKEILVHYQPKFDIQQNKITGVEALVRWNKNNREIIYPDEFISILEETGLIISIGEYVMEKACHDISELNKNLDISLKLAVNLSGVQFSDPLLISKISSILDKTGFPAELLEVEITESIAMHDRENTLIILEELNRKGISIAVDDFGTGYSSLSYLKKFPLSTLKIDKSFIDEMDQKDEDQGIVKTIISLAEIMNLNVVAEGVETGSQIEILKNNQCNEAQGYYISRPTDIKNLQKLLTRKS